MAIESIKEIHEGRDGDITLLDGERLRTRVFRTITTDNQDDSSVVEAGLAAAGFAVYLGSFLPSDPGCYCQRIRSQNASFSKRVWITTCDYSNKLIDNPLNDPAEIDWDTQQQSKIFIRDRNGNWVMNSAGFLYDPPAEIDDSRVSVRVVKNVQLMPSWFPLGYKDAVNNDNFTIDGRNVAVGKAKMMSLSLSGTKTRSNISYRVLTMSIGLNEDGWDIRLLDQGFYQIDPSNSALRTSISSDFGQDLTQPWPLDGSGYKLLDPSPSNVVFRTHEGYQTASFGSLPLT